jgi:DNA-binding HxlR family transcriptional regulator/putative sterol carrier protein
MNRSYGQFCGVARALEIVGERWAMLVVRDLILAPKRFSELRETLPRVPSSILAARLNELELSGVVRRRVLPQLDAAVVYELTEYGHELEDIVLQLGLWGARSLTEPTASDVFSLDTAILSLYTTFRPEAALGQRLSFELRFGDLVLHALVDDGTVKVAEGRLPDPDLVIASARPILPLLNGTLEPAAAVQSGTVRITGDPELLERFVEMFHVPAAPKVMAGLSA